MINRPHIFVNRDLEFATREQTINSICSFFLYEQAYGLTEFEQERYDTLKKFATEKFAIEIEE